MVTTLTREAASGPNAISGALALVTKRLRLACWLRYASRGALVGVAAAFLAALLAHFDFLPDWLPLEAAVLVPIGLGLLVGTVTAFRKPISLMDAARLAEARLGLKERLSSALEFEQNSAADPDPEAALLRRMQLRDAVAHARTLNAVDAVPLRLPNEAKALGAASVLLLLALILPNLPVFIPPGVQIERKIVQKTGSKLEKTATLIQKQAEAQHLEGTRRAALAMQRLGQRLAQGKTDKKQAMVQMSKLTQQMRQEQQKTAQANSSAGPGNKSLAQAGQQLAQAMAGGQSTSGSGSTKQAGAGQKNGGGSKSGQKPGQNGGAGGKNGNGDQFHGFNIPPSGKSASNPNQSSSNAPPTPELQKAAQAMAQNDSQGLSEQLRQMASRTEAGKLSPAEQARATQDLQNLATALQNTPMPETQQHTQAAADALKRGDKATAAAEMRKAADAAEREAHDQADQQGQQDAQQSVEDSESEMAGANSAGDIQDDSGQPGQGQGKEKGSGTGQGQGDGDGLGDGQGTPSSHGKHGSGKGNGGSGGGGMAGGTPNDTGQGSSPLKHLGKVNSSDSSKAVKLYFGKPLNSGPSKTGPTRKVGSNPNALPGQTASSVPYYNYVAPAQKSAESAMDKEDIPPAYRSDVRRYFNSLNPAAGK